MAHCKEKHLTDATNIFENTGVQITKEGHRNLGAALGTRSFTEEYISKQVQMWVDEVKQLATIAQSQLHAAYAALTHGLTGRWSYLSQTVCHMISLEASVCSIIGLLEMVLYMEVDNTLQCTLQVHVLYVRMYTE